MEILHQIGALVLQALPTVVLVLIFFLFLRSQFFAPIQKVMAERAARIEGARREAEAGRVAAEEKKKAYLDALRKARAEVYTEQEAARRTVLDERAKAIRDARAQGNDRVRAAKEKLAAELNAIRGQLEKESLVLGGEIAQAILEGRPSSGAPRGAR